MLLTVHLSQAQKNPYPVSNLRVKKILPENTVLKLDTLSIVPGTVTIKNIFPSQYLIDEVIADAVKIKVLCNFIQFRRKNPVTDFYTIC